MVPVDDIETYCENGVWKTRWRDSPEPFAAGGGKQRQVSQGATVAQWYGVDHIITNPDGTLAEHNSYRYRREAHATGDLDASEASGNSTHTRPTALATG